MLAKISCEGLQGLQGTARTASTDCARHVPEDSRQFRQGQCAVEIDNCPLKSRFGAVITPAHRISTVHRSMAH